MTVRLQSGKNDGKIDGPSSVLTLFLCVKSNKVQSLLGMWFNYEEEWFFSRFSIGATAEYRVNSLHFKRNTFCTARQSCLKECGDLQVTCDLPWWTPEILLRWVILGSTSSAPRIMGSQHWWFGDPRPHTSIGIAADFVNHTTVNMFRSSWGLIRLDFRPFCTPKN